ncbi:MAG: 30S ribosomal protein S14 [Candidatus Diapherotrites archaeon]
MNSEGKEEKKFDKKGGCRRCGTRRGLISKYSLFICRRCFKDIAEKIGFRKYD